MPAGQRGLWRHLRAAGAERAAPHSLSPEGCPRSSSAASAQTGSPNPNGAEQLHHPPQNSKEQLEPAWNMATERITSEALLMKWMNLERIKQEVSQKEKTLDSRRMVLTNLFTQQQWRCRHREQTYGQGWGTSGRG